MTKNVAVIGSGVSGLTAAYELSRRGHAVTIFEKEDRVGGHSLTVEVDGTPLDVGFQVFNEQAYPNLVRFFDEMGVEMDDTCMSFAVSGQGRVEWGSKSVCGLLGSWWSNLLRPRMWSMLYDMWRFHRHARDHLRRHDGDDDNTQTLRQFCADHGYGEAFMQSYMVPFCACVWSRSPEESLDMRTTHFLRFMDNHSMLSVFSRLQWKTPRHRSSDYVSRVVNHDNVRVKAGVAVRAVVASVKGGDGVEVVFDDDTRPERFDAVILATHADQAAAILPETDPRREQLLGVPYTPNRVVVHRDPSVMPQCGACWSTRTSRRTTKGAVACTYWPSSLQGVPDPNVFVTLNPARELAGVVHDIQMRHPQLTWGQALQLQAPPGCPVHVCGAYEGFGFHEDGHVSGLRAANELLESAGLPGRTVHRPISGAPSAAADVFCRTLSDGVRVGRLWVQVPGRGMVRCGQPASEVQGAAVTLKIHDPSFFNMLAQQGDLGFANAFMAGFVTTDDLTALMCVLLDNRKNLQGSAVTLSNAPYLLRAAVAHWMRANTIAGSQANIRAHYDLSNDMFRLFLDPTMTYSCALFGQAGTDDLETAQKRKYARLIDSAEITASDHVLEIGCGWGWCAVQMVRTTGCRVTGLTLSRDQLAFAQDLVRREKLEDRIELLEMDYRHAAERFAGSFDKVVSIEMIEAVGKENLPTYFACISKSLKPGGTAALQAISLCEDQYEAYCRGDPDFIQQYIFPGGHCPALSQIVTTAASSNLTIDTVYDMRSDYAKTLRCWDDAFMAKRRQVLALGFDERFVRMFHYYFCYCEAGFMKKNIYLYQLRMHKEPESRTPA